MANGLNELRNERKALMRALDSLRECDALIERWQGIIVGRSVLKTLEPWAIMFNGEAQASLRNNKCSIRNVERRLWTVERKLKKIKTKG